MCVYMVFVVIQCCVHECVCVCESLSTELEGLICRITTKSTAGMRYVIIPRGRACSVSVCKCVRVCMVFVYVVIILCHV